MKQLTTLLQNAIEDYFKQFPEPTLDHLKEVCEFNLSDIAYKALREAQSADTASEKITKLLQQAEQSLLGAPVGKRINTIAHLQDAAHRLGFNMFYGINEKPYMCHEILHSYTDNNVIWAVGFEKIKK